MKILKIMLTAVAMAGSLFLVSGAASASTSHPAANNYSSNAKADTNQASVYCRPGTYGNNGRLADASQPSRYCCPRGVLCIRHCPPVYYPTARYRYCLPYCPPGYRLQSNGRYWYCTRWYPPPPPRCYSQGRNGPYPRPGYRCPLPEVTRH